MNHFLKGILFLICFFSSISLSANEGIFPAPDFQTKLYFGSGELEIADNMIYIHQGGHLIETNVIRTDHQGFYIFENDITNIDAEKKWKCPYCYHWWPLGQKCQNPDCPTNKW